MTETDQTYLPSALHQGEKAVALALRLAHAENALNLLTQGQADAIVDPSGRAYMLRPAQENLRKNERRLQAIIDDSADVITMVDRGGTILSPSPAMRHVLECEPGELTGTNIFDRVHAEDLVDFYSAYFNVIEGFVATAALQFRFCAHSGACRVINATLGKSRDPAGEGVVLSLRLVTRPQWRRTGSPADGDAAVGKIDAVAALLYEFQEMRAAGTVLDPERHAVEQLSDFFQRHQEEIIHEWGLQAGKLFNGLGLDKLAITEYLPEVISEITRDLAVQRTEASLAEEVRLHPAIRPAQRFHEGLDVGAVVAKYNLLRAAFITIADRHYAFIVGDAALIVNRRIDETVRLAVVSFAAQQEQMRKEQEEEHHAFIAHDLRTPLNAISLLVEELRYGLDEKARREAGDLFEILGRNLERVENLIRRVLETKEQPFSEGNAFRPVRREFELWPLVQRLIRDLEPISARYGIEVVNEISPGLTIMADAELIAAAFQNLLGNAFRYATHGLVVVRAYSASGFVKCEVRDNGTGISPDLLPKVFEKHVSDPYGNGTGLGLAIVKQIVEAHGGLVSVESTQGAGATFTFSLPKPSRGLSLSPAAVALRGDGAFRP